ncbi:caspase family protein [Streptomyces erythrochromogenes]|uniref:caspase family protein n=1 Tax=Streptomyces erythrochromogenes TaxID=285574 RepID=UPI0036C41B91
MGIDAYRVPVPALSGCGNDITEAAAHLRNLLGDRLRLLTLRDGAATLDGIRKAFDQHLGRVRPGDVALFWFSGHGSQAPVPERYWHLEPTGMLQTLVCVDSRHNGVGDLTDKELAHLLDGVSDRGAHVAVVLDCCHSGGGTRDPQPGVRGIPPGTETAADETYAASYERLEREAETPVSVRHVALSACRSFETAQERTVGGKVRGVFSASLLAALATLGPGATYRELHTTARELVQNQVDRQTPVLFPSLPEGIADEPFLGGAVVPASSLTLVHARGMWRVDAGACHGIPDAAEVVLAVSAGDPESAGRRLVVTAVRPGDCDVEPVGWTPRQDRWYPVHVVRWPAPHVAVEVGGTPDDDAGAIETVRAALSGQGGSGMTGLVGPGGDARPADGLRLRVTARYTDGRPVLAVMRADGSPAAPAVTGHDGDSARRVARQVEHIGRWAMIKEAHESASSTDGLIRVEVVPAAPHEALAPRGRSGMVPNGAGEIELAYVRTADGWRAPEVFIRLHNDSGRRLWCVLLDLTERYRCHAALFPGHYVGAGQVAVAAEGRRVPVTLPAGSPVVPGAVGRDWCKLIVSDHEINTLAFHLPSIDEAGGYPHNLRSPASSLRDIDLPRPDLLGKGNWWATSLTPIVTRVPKD